MAFSAQRSPESAAGVATGAVLAAWLGRLAVTRLAGRQAEILRTLAAPA